MRKTLPGCAILALAMTLTACGGDGNSKSDDKGDGPITLDYWNFTSATIPGEAELVKAFEDSHPNIKINLIDMPLDNYQNSLQLGANAGTNPDVFQAIPEWLYDFEHFGVLAPIEGDARAEFEGHFAQAGLQMVTLNNQLLGVPFRFGQSAVFVNTKVAADAGVVIPDKWTWAEFKTFAKAITDAGKGANGFAVPVSSAQSDLGSSWDWLTHFASYGGKMIGDDGKAGFANDVGVKSLQEYAAFYTDNISPQAEVTWVTNDVVQAFGEGKVGAFINGPWYITTIQSSFPDLDFQVVPTPTGSTYGSAAGGSFIAISKGTKHTKEATEFLRYMTSDEVLTKWAEAGQFLPPVPSIVSQEQFQTPFLAPFANYIDEPGIQITGTTPSNTALMTSLQAAVESVVMGRASATDALDKAAADWNKTLDKPY